MRKSGVVAAVLAFGFALAGPSGAQSKSSDDGAGPTTPPAPTPEVPPVTSSLTYPGTATPPPGMQDPNAALPSSSRPFLGQSEDSFDLRSRSGNLVLGGQGASGVLLDELPSEETPELHLVEQRDNLWNLSEGYFKNPWQWPKIWQQNPQIKDPHWIYPGDQVRLRPAGSAARQRSARLTGDGSGGFVDRRPAVPPKTIFLRYYGYVGDPQRDAWGTLVGAAEDQAMLSDGNHVYLQMRPGVDLRLQQLLTLFEAVRQPETPSGARRPKGEIVAVKGTVKVDLWDPRTRIARGEIIESVDVIERGMRVGPVGRRFDVVPPKKSTARVTARILTGFYPYVHMGQNQVVFLDHGSDDGLSSGNLLVVRRQGDAWRTSLATAPSMAKKRLRVDSAAYVDAEGVPLLGDESQFPVEQVAELCILRTEKQASLAMVLHSSRELVSGDVAESRSGY